MRKLDTDTRQFGLEGPFTYWEDDHTALVHVLWGAQHDGALNRAVDCDDLADRIMSSRWMQAVKARAAGDVPGETR